MSAGAAATAADGWPCNRDSPGDAFFAWLEANPYVADGVGGLDGTRAWVFGNLSTLFGENITLTDGECGVSTTSIVDPALWNQARLGCGGALIYLFFFWGGGWGGTVQHTRA